MEVLDRYLSATPIPAPRAEPQSLASVTQRLIGLSGWAESARRAVLAHAAHDASIILEGEPGSGKEFLARLIHDCSHRRRGPFVAVSFDGVSEESAEAVLFGTNRAGRSDRSITPASLLESAHGGTIYINGLGGMKGNIRDRIAGFIRCSEFRIPAGESFENPSVENSDVRTLLGCLSSEEISDLPISDRLTASPLRRRREDIEPLIGHFIKRACEHLKREQREITPDAMAVLRNHDWPGNVVELRSVITEMVAKSGPPALNASLIPGYIAESSGFASRALPAAGINLGDELERIEKTLIVEALRMSHGVQYKAAQLLGLKPTTLNMKLSRLGIDPKTNS
jgi:DNA-binding NtrC family response regulator